MFDKIPVTYRQIIFIVALAACFTNWVNAPLALFTGIIIAFTIGHPFIHLTHIASKLLLQIAVVGLGFGMNVHAAIEAGKQGVLLTLCSVTVVMLLGLVLGKLFGINRNIRVLISGGTAICGGSAIAAIGPAIKAKEEEISVSFATIFILNAVALILFPQIGSLLNLSEHTFGMWAAIAIHDTSSVAGAGQSYGPEALQTALTVKLIRTMWLIPLILVITFSRKKSSKKITVPWFVVGFVAAMFINTYATEISELTRAVSVIAKKLLVITLFLIGAGLSRNNLKKVGLRPLLFGLTLWIIISVVSVIIVQVVF